MADVEELLKPVSEENPVGADLDYDSERDELRMAFDTSVSIDTSGEASQGVEADWRSIIRLIEAQSAKTKDLALAVYLCRAGAKSGQLEVVETGAQYLAGLLERYWENVHPQLEEYEFQGRKGACEALANRSAFLGPLERVTLLEHPRLGRFSGADFVRFQANAEAEDGYALFRKTLEETPEEALTTAIARLDSIADGIRRADKVLVDNAGQDTGVNFKPTYDLIAEIRRAVQSFTAAPAAAAEPAAGESAEEAGAGAGAAVGGAEGPRIAGRVESREDVIRAIDAICDYYRRREPASPVASALQRVREWVNLDFLTLLEDIAPGAIDEAKRVLVSQRKPPSESTW